MATDPHPKPSFSPYRKWGIGLHVLFLVARRPLGGGDGELHQPGLFSALPREHAHADRAFPAHGRLAPVAHQPGEGDALLRHARTSRSLYSTVADLLGEYRLVNPRITVQTVDYIRDPGLAQKIKAKYNLSALTDKNLVIFDCEGKVKADRGQRAGQLRDRASGQPGARAQRNCSSSASRRPSWARSPSPRPCWTSPAPGRSRPISSRATVNTKLTAATR